MVQEVGTNEKLKAVAERWQLSKWLKENPCQVGQEAAKTTLASTVEAIIGAVWFDSNRNLAEVQLLIKRLQA